MVELGCGSGETAARLVEAGYDVLGIDQSPQMLALARERAPGARFRAGSWHDAEIPPCAAVLAIGEVLGYLGAARGTKAELRGLFRRVAAALPPGGPFIFDLAIPGRLPGGEAESWRSGEDWALLYRARERGHELVREIEVFRRDGRGAGYRRTRETHRLRLRPTGEITALLRECGFRVRVRRGYDERLLLPGHRVFLARRL